ncbi:MAG: DUF4426 domain-containing protein [Gammaproteobacteria bacterium]
MTKRFAYLLLSGSLLFSTAVGAEQSRSFGDYTIHYSAFPSDMLTPEVARDYGIKRSKNRALLNISVLKKHMGTTGVSATAVIEGTAKNLNQQLRNVDFKEIKIEAAVYYLGQVRVSNEETLEFELNITPTGEDAALNFSFKQQFFTE